MNARRRIEFKFCLYVADGTQNSAVARSNLAELCRKYLRENYEIEIVDVLSDPQRALDNGIFITPTLVRLRPSPGVRIIGNLNHTPRVLLMLELHEAAT